MAQPYINAINKAYDALYDAFASNKLRSQGRYAVGLLNKLEPSLRSLYVVPTARDLTVNDATDADLAALYADDGELGVLLGRAARVGDVFMVGGTGDTTDNALAAAKNAGLEWTADVTVTDTTDATIAAFIAVTGEHAAVLGRALQPGYRFKVAGNGDTTDNALQAAKGSAPADEDVFEVNAAADGVTYIGNAAAVADGDVFEVTGATTVKFLGNASVLALTDDQVEDFISLGA